MANKNMYKGALSKNGKKIVNRYIQNGYINDPAYISVHTALDLDIIIEYILRIRKEYMIEFKKQNFGVSID